MRLYIAGLLPKFKIVGVSLDDLDEAEFRSLAADACAENARHSFDQCDWQEFADHLTYLSLDQAEDGLADVVGAAAEELGPETRLFLERLWEVSAPLLEDGPPVKPYPPGSWGPTEIGALIAPNGWRLPFARPWREASGADR